MAAPLRKICEVERVPWDTSKKARGVTVTMVCGHQKFIGGILMPSNLLGTQTECVSGCYVPDTYMGRY